MKKSQRTINKHLKELRELIDTSKDPLETRIAYAMETAVRWATEDTVGWEGLKDQAINEAAILKKEPEAQDE